MAMRPCEQCLENWWTYKKLDDGWTRATCQICGNEVEWEKSKKDWKEGDLCTKCDTPVEFKESKFKPQKLKKPYYFTHYLICPKCKTFYMNDKYKILN